METFIDFLGFINHQLNSRGIERLEEILMAANFSSIVGEFVKINIPKHTMAMVKNRYHNGHPDLLPAGRYPGDAVQHGEDGVEVKASRYHRGWQGHNAENCWLMVFVFDANGPDDIDPKKDKLPKPFQFFGAYGARLELEDWKFAGRSATSRRTITASVTPSGYRKMTDNWIYKAPGLTVREAAEAARTLLKPPQSEEQEE